MIILVILIELCFPDTGKASRELRPPWPHLLIVLVLVIVLGNSIMIMIRSVSRKSADQGSKSRGAPFDRLRTFGKAPPTLKICPPTSDG
jgi:hypothetical protein